MDYRCGLATVVISALFAFGCTTLPPTDATEREVALGRVTVSPPLFVPLDSTSPDKRLNFGAQKSEEELRKAIMQPSLGVTLLQYRMLQLSLALKASGPSIDSTKTIAKGTQPDGSDKETETSTETMKTPSGVPAAGSEETPSKILDKLAALFDRSSTTYGLTPDQVSSLVAAYKTYMNNLEDYYNAEAFKAVNGQFAEYLPYRVHFTVSMDPGWWVREHSYDAVLDLDLQIEGRSPNDFYIVSVSPAETAQAIDSMSAAMRVFGVSLSVEGSYGPVAAKAALDYVKSDAERLEGLYNNKTTIVSFPSQNRVRVRFRARAVPNKDQWDMQPESRLMTAVVLVRALPNRTTTVQPYIGSIPEVRALEAVGIKDFQDIPSGDSTTDLSVDQARKYLDTLVALQDAVLKATDKEENAQKRASLQAMNSQLWRAIDYYKTALADDQFALAYGRLVSGTNDNAPASLPTLSDSLLVKPARCNYITNCCFEPPLQRNLVNGAARSSWGKASTSYSGEEIRGKVHVPIWNVESGKRLRLLNKSVPAATRTTSEKSTTDTKTTVVELPKTTTTESRTVIDKTSLDSVAASQSPDAAGFYFPSAGTNPVTEWGCQVRFCFDAPAYVIAYGVDKSDTAVATPRLQRTRIRARLVGTQGDEWTAFGSWEGEGVLKGKLTTWPVLTGDQSYADSVHGGEIEVFVEIVLETQPKQQPAEEPQSQEPLQRLVVSVRLKPREPAVRPKQK